LKSGLLRNRLNNGSGGRTRRTEQPNREDSHDCPNDYNRSI
jgi:hypothetical protein